ncbi:MAG: hypothetical protein GY762_14815 [Proteobacteria bacterium]|nr:hypothetical protein [Pseudomonadota bacterium]
MFQYLNNETVSEFSSGDGTTDYELSTVVTWGINFFVGHFKLGYIFNGRNDSGLNLGDKFLYMLKGDFIVLRGNYTAMKRLAVEMGLNGSMKFKDRDADGEYVDNSYIYRPLNIVTMVKWTSVKGFFVRPRLIIPITPLAKGGRIGAVVVLDLAYSF